MVEQRIAYRFQEEIPQTIILFQNSADVFLINSKVDIPNDISENEYNRIIDSAYYASDLIKHIDANEFGEALDESSQGTGTTEEDSRSHRNPACPCRRHRS